MTHEPPNNSRGRLAFALTAMIVTERPRPRAPCVVFWLCTGAYKRQLLFSAHARVSPAHRHTLNVVIMVSEKARRKKKELERK